VASFFEGRGPAGRSAVAAAAPCGLRRRRSWQDCLCHGRPGTGGGRRAAGPHSSRAAKLATEQLPGGRREPLGSGAKQCLAHPPLPRPSGLLEPPYCQRPRRVDRRDGAGGHFRGVQIVSAPGVLARPAARPAACRAAGASSLPAVQRLWTAAFPGWPAPLRAAPAVPARRFRRAAPPTHASVPPAPPPPPPQHAQARLHGAAPALPQPRELQLPWLCRRGRVLHAARARDHGGVGRVDLQQPRRGRDHPPARRAGGSGRGVPGG
jgi:hypothetical protein